MATASSTDTTPSSRALAPNQRCSSIHSASSCEEMLGAPARSSTAPASSAVIVVLLLGLCQQEPEEPARLQREQVGQLSDAGETGASEHLDGRASLVVAQVELDGLGGA